MFPIRPHSNLKKHCYLYATERQQAMIIPHWVHHVGKPTENSLLLTEIVHTFDLFSDDDPGSIIPKHYRRVEIKYSKLGEKR